MEASHNRPQRVLALQHVPFEGVGQIGPWLLARGHQLTIARVHETAALPHPADVDLLVIMGGPMGVHDEAEHPWLREEKRFVRAVIDRGAAVLGICLGAQLIATVLGAAVGPNPVKEIGWFPVEAVPSDGRTTHRLLPWPSTATVLHWHGETFALPAGAVRLARSAACDNQAFQLGARIIGFQFHLETTPEGLRQMVQACGDELQPAATVQSAEQLLAAPETTYAHLHDLLGEVLEFLLQAEPPKAVAGTFDVRKG